MTIKIFNTISKKKEIFQSTQPNSVTMYVCGPTVYSHPHIGNARAALVPDVLFRLLKSKYQNVLYIRNITDVDDKISEAAFKQNKTVYEISNKFIKIYQDNMASLNILEPTLQPKVTDNMLNIIGTIEKILMNGFAYVSDNHVLFDTNKYKNYGELSKRTLDEMIDGARIDIADYKKSPRDFILWKPSDRNQPGWESPWGMGRPGWHIECTSMIKNIIGDDNTLDIHGGGNDLIFPHHENEIAQGSCMSSSKYCNFWFHNGIVLVNKKKMSKSLGNVILLDDLLGQNTPNSIRLALLSAHYRQPLNWSDSTLIESSNLIKKFSILAKSYTGDINSYNNLEEEMISILSDDLNTPEAIKYLSELAKSAKKNQRDLAALIKSADFIGLNLLVSTPHTKNIIDEDLVRSMINERVKARVAGDFKKADKIRDKLLSMGILIKDLEGETVWDYNPDN
ncbi:MAG: cysteine--tRNA ligase [Gammaproteobacteria bacterium]|jgi:cysteinyl-tRNA synthetase|nr:cysteine--tRNA ligase [Gammaproteobacteria bacterium]MBT4655016.1 cysteine--tRNA ligase [Gammaproteobacteria bacterium]MBT5761128.1 cysteine--tRNA ligase [Gammaproteobacteria bacterium]MBT6331438.1 cysteine--tRNA ligase [Gammaproteobacteria bacterium]MBT7323188.1 cysteine--tRNA ligase [Gammaproteobacteria bacterium]